MNHRERMRKIANGGYVSGQNSTLHGIGSRADISGYFSANRGYIPERVAKALDQLAEERGGYEGVVYSYRTPIALKIAGVWFAPDVSYSATTGGKHQSLLSLLGDLRWIPWDSGIMELRSVIDGDIVYTRGSGYKKAGK